MELTDTLAERPAEEDAARAERELSGLARGGGLNVLAAIVSQASLLGITAILVKLLDRAAVGLYAQGFAFLVLLNLLSLSGFRAGLTRFVAVHRADGDAASVHGTTRIGVGISMATSLLLGVVLLLFAKRIGIGVFSNPALVGPLRAVGLALPASTVTDAALSATQGFKTMRPYALIGMVYEPGARFVLTLALVLAGFGLPGAMAALVVSNWTAAALALRALHRLLGPRPSALRYEVAQLFRFSAISWLASLASSGLVWADTILLGFYRTNAEVGLYNVATRLVMIATFVAVPISASFAPRIADLSHRGATEALGRSYRAATGWILRLSLPAFVALLVVPRDLLDVFGPSYRTGVTVTVLLAVGKLVDAATGPCGVMLNQSGRPGLSVVDNVAALVLNVALNLYLIPRHGVSGAALAWLLSLVIVNVARVLQVYLVLGLWPFARTAANGMMAAAASAVAALALRILVSGAWSLVLSLPLIVAVYLGMSALLGLTEDDRLALQILPLRGRRGRARSRQAEGRPSVGRAPVDVTVD